MGDIRNTLTNRNVATSSGRLTSDNKAHNKPILTKLKSQHKQPSNVKKIEKCPSCHSTEIANSTPERCKKLGCKVYECIACKEKVHSITDCKAKNIQAIKSSSAKKAKGINKASKRNLKRL